jgi:hypothetical protein
MIRPGSEAEYRERESRRLVLSTPPASMPEGRPPMGAMAAWLLIVVAAGVLFGLLVFLR